MKTFKEHLTEVFDNPVKYRWQYKDEDEWMAQFQIDGNKYSAGLIRSKMPKNRHKDWWELMFDVETKDSIFATNSISKTGNEFIVFATVFDILKEWMKSNTDATFYFTAKEKTRKKLYDRFAKLLQTKFKYKLTLGTTDGGKSYKFTK